jgi:hypothetical protein
MSDGDLKKVEEKLLSGRYADIFIKHYGKKVEMAKEEKIKAAITKFCGEYEKYDPQKLAALKKDLEESEYPKKHTRRILAKIEGLLREYEKKRAAEFFKGLDFATQEQLDSLKKKLKDGGFAPEILNPYLKKIALRETEILDEELIDLCKDVDHMSKERLGELEALINNADKSYNAVLLKKCNERIAGRHCELKNSELAELCKDILTMDAEKLAEVEVLLRSDKYDPELENFYLKKVAERKVELSRQKLEKRCENIEKTDMQGIQKLKADILNDAEFADISAPFIERIEQRQKRLTEMEVEELCGNIDEITVKKSFDIIRQINIIKLDDSFKNKYLDRLDSHIMTVKEREAREYSSFVKNRISEFKLPADCIFLPGVNDDFDKIYDCVCKIYVTPGRFEMPVLTHEASPDEGFTITTEYLYYNEKPSINGKIKLDDIASFQAKKGLVTSALNFMDKNGNSVMLPNSFAKAVIEDAVKVLTALISHVRDKRAEEHMKEAVETAAAISGKTKEIVTPQDGGKPPAKVAAEPAANKKEPVPVNKEINSESKKSPDGNAKFCDECGAKVVNEKAKFCHECGNRLVIKTI